jgi:Fe-S cluster assembly protein SufD
VLIVGGVDCEASVIETYVSAGAESYWTNTVTEIFAAENARIGHYKIQKEHGSAFHTGYVHMVQQRTSVVNDHSLAFGGGLVRNDIRAVLADQGADCNLNGLYTIGGAQHVDNHTVIDHAKPHCTSHELYKGVLDGRSTGVFSGKIIVRKDAQKTDAIQSNKNLLLSDQANINTKPQLEIEADDVRCTHGATVGQMDEEALFYLQSRAIGIKEARSLLTYAFAADILDRVRFEPVRARLEAELFDWLGREQKTEQPS